MTETKTPKHWGEPPWHHCHRCQEKMNFYEHQSLGYCKHCDYGSPKQKAEEAERREAQEKRFKEITLNMRKEALTNAREVLPEYAFMLVDYYIGDIGRQGWMVSCSECGEYFRLYEWSFRGNGSKKCPECGYKHRNICPPEPTRETAIGYRKVYLSREGEIKI